MWKGSPLTFIGNRDTGTRKKPINYTCSWFRGIPIIDVEPNRNPFVIMCKTPEAHNSYQSRMSYQEQDNRSKNSFNLWYTYGYYSINVLNRPFLHYKGRKTIMDVGLILPTLPGLLLLLLESSWVVERKRTSSSKHALQISAAATLSSSSVESSYGSRVASC